MDSYKENLLKYLKSLDLMALATVGDRPAVCTVYYGIDDDFKIYVVTPPSTEHGKNIAENHKVACSVTDTQQRMYGTPHKIGVQIYGTAEEVTDPEKMKEALRVWSKDREDIVEKYMTNINNKTWQSKPHIIKPSQIKWFNEALYGDEGVEVFEF